jgi:hypothetical protein
MLLVLLLLLLLSVDVCCFVGTSGLLGSPVTLAVAISISIKYK